MIIFDLDGTLADCEHRKHLIEPENYPKICEYSNYHIKDDMITHWEKPSWRYKKDGKPFKNDFQTFYEACDMDKPIDPTIQIMDGFYFNSKDLDFFLNETQIWSGRCESVREKTMDWLLENILFDKYAHKLTLKMRPIGDNTPLHILKEKWLEDATIETKWGNRNPIDMVFDSDPESIKMWHRRGIFVFNCAQHDEEF